MHNSAMKTGKLFFDNYCQRDNLKIVDIGSQNVNGSLRDVAPNNCEYVGVDFEAGNGVDVVLTDAYKFPFPDNTFDVLVTSSCFEHSEMFWLTFLEGIRVLKSHGLMYCNAPADNMHYHKFPVDCWRFYPDAGKGLCAWAKHNGYNTEILETYITDPKEYPFHNDWVCIFVKDQSFSFAYPNRIRELDNYHVDMYNHMESTNLGS